jgi:hypothetical protein
MCNYWEIINFVFCLRVTRSATGALGRPLWRISMLPWHRVEGGYEAGKFITLLGSAAAWPLA